MRLYKDKQWKIKGTVKRKCKEHRSYLVETDSGKILRRNRCHILKAPQKDPSDASESESYQELESISNQSQPTGISDSLPNPPLVDPAPNQSRHTTRSGREVRRPAYLNDYDTSG